MRRIRSPLRLEPREKHLYLRPLHIGSWANGIVAQAFSFDAREGLYERACREGFLNERGCSHRDPHSARCCQQCKMKVVKGDTCFCLDSGGSNIVEPLTPREGYGARIQQRFVAQIGYPVEWPLTQ